MSTLENAEYVIVGLNATGRTLALLLGAAGVDKITLVDNNVVSDTNQQGYMSFEKGMLKTTAVKDTLGEMCSTKITTANSISEIMETLTCNISGNVILIVCDAMTPKSKVHLCNELHSVCKSVFFVGFYSDGENSVTHYRNMELESMGLDTVSSLPEGKESLREGRIAASRIFGAIVNVDYSLL